MIRMQTRHFARSLSHDYGRCFKYFALSGGRPSNIAFARYVKTLTRTLLLRYESRPMRLVKNILWFAVGFLLALLITVNVFL